MQKSANEKAIPHFVTLGRNVRPNHIFRLGVQDLSKVTAAGHESTAKAMCNRPDSLGGIHSCKASGVPVFKPKSNTLRGALLPNEKTSNKTKLLGRVIFPEDSFRCHRNADIPCTFTTTHGASEQNTRENYSVSEIPAQYDYKLLDLSSAVLLADLSSEAKISRVLVHESSNESAKSYHFPTTLKAHVEDTIACDTWALEKYASSISSTAVRITRHSI